MSVVCTGVRGIDANLSSELSTLKEVQLYKFPSWLASSAQLNLVEGGLPSTKFSCALAEYLSDNGIPMVISGGKRGDQISYVGASMQRASERARP